ncbi:MAG TPA: DNA polymerase III subunit gamma/tau [Pseudogracilibacillus sp.]|nr:DNA polymerase III subunit gamma/tau [Pseudogracilibacillus sp.]
MSYQALYRVYRPRTFADVVGQSHIVKTLQNAISSERFSHAYLFSGPRGTGKTSVAKIVAQALNCEKMPTKDPCNECAACKGILNGTIPDVIEIDAASNTSVDDIRDIRDKVKFAPSSVPYKVYIIDEVHMISVSAFNALLKTLEEPPAHVVFILATTEPHKIPLTIISRCQRFDFKAINNQTIKKRLATIMEREQINMEEEALEAVALAAEGGMRDALSILDQVIAYSDGEVTIDDVLAVTGSVSQQILTEMTKALYTGHTHETMELFDAIIQSGKDPSRFVFDYIYFLRDVLFYKTTSQLEAFLERAIVTEQFKNLVNEVEPEWIKMAINELTRCEQQLKWTNSPKIYVEVSLLTIATRQEQLTPVVSESKEHGYVAMLTEQINRLEQKINELEKRPKVAAAPKQTEQRTNRQPRKHTFDVPYERIKAVLDEAEKSAIQKVRTQWEYFLQQLKQANAPAHATIQDSRPVAASSTTLIVSFKYEIHCSLFLDHKEMIESLLESVLQTSIDIVPVPEKQWQLARSTYLEEQEESEEKEEKEVDPIIEEARKLVGDNLLEIRD